MTPEEWTADNHGKWTPQEYIIDVLVGYATADVAKYKNAVAEAEAKLATFAGWMEAPAGSDLANNGKGADQDLDAAKQQLKAAATWHDEAIAFAKGEITDLGKLSFDASQLEAIATGGVDTEQVRAAVLAAL